MTCSPYTTAEIDAKIAKLKAMIVAYEDAILALAGGAQTYSLDTGQTRQTVQRVNLATLRDTLASLENQLAVFVARHSCPGSVYARPAF